MGLLVISHVLYLPKYVAPAPWEAMGPMMLDPLMLDPEDLEDEEEGMLEFLVRRAWGLFD